MFYGRNDKLLNPYHPCVSLQPQHTNVCFWYLPPGLRYVEDKVEKMKRLHKVSGVKRVSEGKCL